jgi:sigma-B regulation protein RsbU (phosphoserine phosphatase)
MTGEPIRVLMVDPCAEDRAFCQRLLRQDQDHTYVVYEADCGRCAQHVLATQTPHCVLIECRLPDADAWALLRQLCQTSPERAPTAVVVVTGHGSEQVAAESFAAGAMAYLSKNELTADKLQATVQNAVAHVERQQRELRHHERLERAMGTAAVQLQRAGMIQRKLFPVAAPPIPGFDIAGRCLQAETTGGDFFDYVPLPDGSWGVVLGDVSGHGLGPALVATETRAYIRAVAETCAHPGRVLERTNRLLCQDTGGELFVTLFFAALNPSSRQLRFSSAGHRVVLLDRADAVEALEVDQPPLGIAPHFIGTACEERTLHSGEMLVLLTDGITDCAPLEPWQVAVGPQAGLDQVLQTVRAHRRQSAAQIVDAIFHQASSPGRRPPRPDDMTAVVIKVL